MAERTRDARRSPSPLQRSVEFAQEAQGATRSGFRGSLDYGRLKAAQKKHYEDLLEDQQTTYRFRDKAHVLSYLPNPAADPPIALRDTRDEDTDISKNTTSYTSGGASRFVVNTRPHMSNWRAYVIRHANKAKAIVGNTSKDAQIDTLRDDALAWADEMDRVESPTTFLGSAGSEVSAPYYVADRVNKMYQTASAPYSAASIKVPRFGGQINGMGTWASIDFNKNDSFPEGSSASGTQSKMEWVGKLAKRRRHGTDPGPGRGHLYIRGHLLNDHLGGPSVASNLAPIIGVDVPGAPNSNAAHSSIIEGQVRQEFSDMRQEIENVHGSPMTREPYRLVYTVLVTSFGGHQRNCTQNLKVAHENFADRVAKMKEQDVTKSKLGELKEFLGKQTNPANYAQVWTSYLKQYVHAVWDSNDDDKDASVISLLMLANRAFAAYEDTVLPRELRYYYAVYDLGGNELRGDSKTIPAGPADNALLGFREN